MWSLRELGGTVKIIAEPMTTPDPDEESLAEVIKECGRFAAWVT